MVGRRWSRTPALLLVLSLATATAPAKAIMSGDDEVRALPADDDFAKGVAAFEREDWRAVIEHMNDAVERRPWHDEAYNLLGFAHRKLGDYDRSLDFYDKALTLNPHNRGALEYLGEAYLDLGRPEDTKEILSKLALECERIGATFENGDWRQGCEEWAHLNATYQAHIEGRPRPEHD